MARNPAAVCVYCGSLATTVDHIPPKAIIPAKSRVNLLAVPSCRKCNNGFSKDDEYLMYLSTFSAGSSDAEEVGHKVRRWWQKPNKQRMAKDFFGNVRPVQVRTWKGGTTIRHAAKVQPERVRSSCERIITALYFFVQGTRLPPTFRAVALPPELPGPDVEDSKLICGLRFQLRQMLRGRPEHVIGEDAFAYRYSMEVGYPNRSVWELRLFRSIRVYGMTTKTDEKGIEVPGVIRVPLPKRFTSWLTPQKGGRQG
jgi:hypothetical protein